MPRGGHKMPRGSHQMSSAPGRNHLYTDHSADGRISGRQQGDERVCSEVLVVTDDFAERDTVITLGGMASSCENFIREIDSTLKGLAREVTIHNDRERRKFKNSSVK